MNWDSLNDLSLVAQVIAGSNDRAFERLVRKYQSPIRRFFLNQTTGDDMLSDDLAQETFILAYRKIQTFHQLSSFRTWLFSIAYHVWLSHIRQMKVTAELNEEVTEERFEQHQSTEIRLDLASAMQVLTDIERSCITLFYIEDLSADKVADITELPIGTVKSHIHRGKTKLAQYLRERGYHE